MKPQPITKTSKSFYKLPKTLSKYISIGIAIAVLNLSVSCSYFSVRDVPTTEENIAKQVDTFNTSEKYVIVHSGILFWHLRDMILNDDEQMISGTIEPVNEAHNYKKPRDKKRVHRYVNKKTNPLNEVHFYLKTAANFHDAETVNISLSDINRISVNDKNTGRTVANVLLTTVGAVFFVSAVYLALKSSCPFVYIKDGQEYQFVGELYPGAITPNLQRNDYLALPNFCPENEWYTLKVSNQLKEIQYTDQLQLISVNHPKNIEVLIDSKGAFQTFESINSPIKILDESDTQKLDLALKKDNNYYAFNSLKSTSNSIRSIIFEFDKPENAEEVKLYLTAKNSVWLDYVFGKFNEQFGAYYNTFQKKQQTVDKEQLSKWANGQNIPLSVYVKTKSGWELVERLNSVGPLAMRDLVVPIHLDSTTEEILQIKLETGFMFWEVDYVGVDFSENLNLSLTYINPVSALDQNENDVTHLLNNRDEKYFVQPNIGDEVTVSFPSTPSIDDLETTVFLKNRGYYNYLRDYKGIPDQQKLESFRDDGAFTIFSEKSYFEFVNFSLNNLAQNE
ncbi:MAG: hypothetical protein V7719_02480 [Psychroserpens sp.]|uniref:hypothetical protein n=1 Tax=Psychroserpens sp. TaxID=2020870 RepID=UPI0030021D1F